MKCLIVLIFCSFCFSLNAQKKKADAIYYNGVVYSVDDSSSMQQAFAIKDGKFLEVGSTSFILSKYESTIKINLKKK
ncbi:MAG: amidohydrolase, partial [Bacteroidia bacterium]|nr:amidohydrolase [Bacteroidia bacterium]